MTMNIKSINTCLNNLQVGNDTTNSAAYIYNNCISAEKEIQHLTAALESINALIENDMGEWYAVEFAHLPIDYANRAHIRNIIQEVKSHET